MSLTLHHTLPSTATPPPPRPHLPVHHPSSLYTPVALTCHVANILSTVIVDITTLTSGMSTPPSTLKGHRGKYSRLNRSAYRFVLELISV